MPRIDTEKLTEYAQRVFDRSSYFNDYVLRTIGRRMKAIGQLNTADQIALKNMADISGDMEAITKQLAEITEMNVEDIEEIYSKVIQEGVNSYKPLFDFKNMEFVPFEHNEFAQQLVRNWAAQTAGEMINLSRTKALCFDKYNLKGELIGSTPLKGAFQQAVDDAVVAVSTGTVDFNTAMSETIKNLGGSGVKVNYGNNVTRRLDGMIRQNLLYGAKQSAQAYDEYIGAKLGCDGFEVDYHPHARPSHRFMGGVIFSYSGDVTIDGVTYKDGSEALARLKDYGCLHFKDDVILGVSQPRYDEKWLAEQKHRDEQLIEYNGIKKTGYEWKQAQRRLEWETRRQRDISFMAKESGNNTLAKECNAKIKAIREKYDDLCSKTGLEPRVGRMAAYKGKSLTDKAGSGIIENITKETGVADVHYIGKIDREIYKCVTEDIVTDEVIITNRQIEHIKERHPDNYEKYSQYFNEIVKKPDYIIEANKPNTALILKKIQEAEEEFKTVLRLVTSTDGTNIKNSIITFMKIDEKEWNRLIKNKKILYKSE